MSKKRILVVDDSTSVRGQVAQALTGAGFEVVEAVDGVDGVDMIASTEGLAAVICDVNMPRMSGLDLVERVRRDGRHAALPILMLTTEGQPALIQRAKAAGARGWIIKPFKPDLLVAAVRKVAS